MDTAMHSADKTYLSTDQRYPHDICTAVTTVFYPENLSHKNHGKFSRVRWLTTANRIFRVYIGTNGPPNELQVLSLSWRVTHLRGSEYNCMPIAQKEHVTFGKQLNLHF